VRVVDAERIARSGGEPAVGLVLGLLAEITALRERVDEHERLLKRDSTNSSLAPSNDPPLKLKKHRPTLLPMTLQASERGSSLCAPGISPGCARLEIWLTRGKKLILNIHGTVFKERKFGLQLAVARAARKGDLHLKVTFIPPGGINPTEIVNLTIRERA